MATRITRLPGKIIATDTSTFHPLGLTDAGLFASGGVATIIPLSGNIFFSTGDSLDKNAAASATVGTNLVISFGPSIGDINYQATTVGDSFLISV